LGSWKLRTRESNISGKTYIFQIVSDFLQLLRANASAVPSSGHDNFFQIPSNFSFRNHGRQNEQCDMLKAASSDPHNINTSSLLPLRYTACNTAVIFFFFTLGFLLSFSSSHLTPSHLRNLMVLLFINQLIHSCIHSLLSPFAILP
jgi:hypothetical protein